MTWRVAEALDTLLGEINDRSPNRSKASDGALGDAAHASRNSDHNPWVKDGSTGVVTARDFTNDPAHGFDSSDFAEWLRKRCKGGTERRVKYIISDRRIASESFSAADRAKGRKAWEWWPYNGLNAHLHHVHVSVASSKALYDNQGSWGWEDAGKPAKPAPPKGETVAPTEVTLSDATIKRITEGVVQQTIKNRNEPGPDTITTLGASVADQEVTQDRNHTAVMGKLGELVDAVKALTAAVAPKPEA